MFPDGVHGLAMSDPVDGKFRVITTEDAGDTWKKVDPSGMPKAKDGEFGFAASGTCVVTAGIKDAWIASGGTASRVFHSTDYGQTWTVAKTPIPPNADGGGVFSLAFRTAKIGIAVGGNFLEEDNGRRMSARTSDGGATWTRGGNVGGYRSGVAWVPFSHDRRSRSAPTAPTISTDGGKHLDRHRQDRLPLRPVRRHPLAPPAGPAAPTAGSASWSACPRGSALLVEEGALAPVTRLGERRTVAGS